MNDMTIELTTWALNIKKAEAQIAAENIAAINVPGGKYKHVDFNKLMKQVGEMSKSGDIDGARAKMAESLKVENMPVSNIDSTANLDAEILKLSAAEGRYKVIAKAMHLKMGLMSIAVTGSKR